MARQSILSPVEPSPQEGPAPDPSTGPEAGQLLEPEFYGPYSTWKADPNPKAAGTLLKAVDPVIDSALRTYGGGAPSPTLRSRAKVLALDAFKRYDPTRAKLRTHLMVHLQGLRRFAAREGQGISIPERVALDLHRIRQSSNELADRLGREPSDIELADHTGLSRKRIGYVRQASQGVAEGVFTSRSEEDAGQTFAPAVVNPAQADNTWAEFIYSDLHPTDQVILEYSLGLHGKPVLPKQAIARKLNLSPGAISQRAARVQALLDKKEDLNLGFF